MNKKALITGCCGFIGSNLTRDLIQRGWVVEGVDDLSTGDLEPVFDIGIRPVPADCLHMYADHSMETSPRTLIINGDFTHEAVLKRIKTGMYDVVFHLAANPYVQQSVEFPVETHETNVFKTLGLFDACKGNVDRIVFASSAAVYGDVGIPTKELALHRYSEGPESPYGLQKLHCEEYADMFNNLYNTDIVSLRLFNVFGPGQYGNSPYSNVIASWCNNIREGKSLRSDGDGNQTRDFCYIDNVVDAFRMVAEWDSARRSSIYNVGCGVNISNNDILDYFKKKYPKIVITKAPPRPGDTRHSQADISRINYELNYRPRVHFYDGLEQTLKWWGI